MASRRRATKKRDKLRSITPPPQPAEGSPEYVHLDVTLNIATLLRAHVESRKLGVKMEKCLCVFPRNDYEPDVVFFAPEKTAAFANETIKFSIPDLIVEVLSDSTETRDRGVKFEDFQAHGVGEYRIGDPERAVIEQYLLRAEGYELALKSGTGELRSVVVKGFAIPALRGLLAK